MASLIFPKIFPGLTQRIIFAPLFNNTIPSLLFSKPHNTYEHKVRKARNRKMLKKLKKMVKELKKSFF